MTIVDPIERSCLELAWRSCRAGTIGVGAVLVDAHGHEIARGNNAIFAPADCGPLEGSRIAHAEMNVFAQVAAGDRPHGATLYTSLEPCAMCAGAILMHDLAAVKVIARDPLMNDLDAMGDRNDWVRSRWLPRSFSSDPVAVRFATLFAMYTPFFWFDQDHSVVGAVTKADPDGAAWINSVVAEGVLAELAEAGADLDQVIEALG